MYLKTHFIIILLLASAISGLTQDKLQLSLAQARQYALENNKNLKNSGFAYDKARQEVWESIANGLPQVAASADYSNSLGAVMSIRFNENLPATEIEMKPSGNAYLNVNQLIFSGNYIVGVQMARLAEEISRIDIQRSEIEVLSQVTEAYYMAQLTAASGEILRQNLTNLQGLYEKTNALGKVGIIEQTDVDQLLIQLMAMKNAVAASKRQQEMALNLLRLQMGAPVSQEIQLTDELSGLVTSDHTASLVLGTFKPEQSIDYRIVQQQEMLANKGVNMQRANALPTLAAFYRHTYQFIEPNFNMTPPNMVGLQLNIPLFSSGLRTSQTRQAVIDLKTARNQLALLGDQLSIQDKQLRYDLTNALESYQNQKESVEVSRRVYQSLKLKYEQGMISGLDLISADNNYLKAEADYLSAMMDVLNARLKMEKLYGTLQ